MSEVNRSLWTKPGTQIIIVMLITIVLGAPTLVYPFGRDQGAHATIAREALRGKTIYTDVFNANPPMTHVVHEIALLAFGQSMRAIRLLDMVWQAAIASILMFVAKRILGSGRSAMVCAALYLVLYYSFDFWNTAQKDGFQTLPMAAAVALVLGARQRSSSWPYILAGCMTAIAALFKYPIAVMLPLLMSVALRDSFKARAKALLLAGGFALTVAVALVVLAARGALPAFLTTQWAYLTQYTVGRAEQYGYVTVIARTLFTPSLATTILWLGGMSSVVILTMKIWPKCYPDALFALLWYLGAAVSYISQAKGFSYHSLPLLGPYALLSAILLHALTHESISSKYRKLALVAVTELMILLPIGTYCLQMVRTNSPVAFLDLATGRRTSREIYLDPRLSGSTHQGFSLVSEVAVAEHIAAHSQPSDTIFVWGFEPTIYFLADREPGSRMLYNHPLYGVWAWPQLRTELLSDLAERRPLYFVVASNDAITPVTGTTMDSALALEEFVELRRYLSAQYVLERAIGNFRVYRRY